jgi:hypothetical protein
LLDPYGLFVLHAALLFTEKSNLQRQSRPLESEPCLARNRFIDHLVIDSSHPILIHGQDLTSLCDLFCRWNKNLINDGDLLWMDRSLAVKT